METKIGPVLDAPIWIPQSTEYASSVAHLVELAL